jgi:hypothetical protein
LIKSKQINDINRYRQQSLATDDYNAFLILTKLEYEAGLIKEQSPSELLRFTIRRLLNQLRTTEYIIY